MLAARRSLARATASLLRRPARRSMDLPKSLQRGYLPFTPPPIPHANTLRFFSLKSDPTEQNLFAMRVAAAGRDSAAALAAFQDLQLGGDFPLSVNQASNLLAGLVKHRHVNQVAQFMDYCLQNNITLKPFACVRAIQSLMETRRFGHVLRLHESMCKDGLDIHPGGLGRVLYAAVETNDQESMNTILKQLMMIKEDREDEDDLEIDVLTGEGAVSLIQKWHANGVKLSEFALQALAAFAVESRQLDVQLTILAMVGDSGVDPNRVLNTKFYNAIFYWCNRENRWCEAVEVYQSMPMTIRMQLKMNTMACVIDAYVRHDEDEMKVQGIEMFDRYKHELPWGFVWNGVLNAQLALHEYGSVLELADEMKQRGIKMTSFTHQLVVLANIQSGSIENAKELLKAIAGKMNHRHHVNCYKKVVKHYVAEHEDPQAICQVYLELVQYSSDLSDWSDALELALQFPDQSMYWELRDIMSARSEELESMLPSHLILNNEHRPSGSAKPGLPLDTEPAKQLPTGSIYGELRKQMALISTGFESILPGRSPKAQELRTDQDIGHAVEESADYDPSSVEASQTLKKLARSNKLDEGLELWNECREEGVALMPLPQKTLYRKLYGSRRFAQALQLFRGMREDLTTLEPWVYGVALDAATKSKQQELVSDILEYLSTLKDAANQDEEEFDWSAASSVDANENQVTAFVREQQSRGVKLSHFAQRSLAAYGDDARNADVATMVFSMVRDQGAEPTIEIYERVLLACGPDKRWADVLDIYQAMSEETRAQLKSTALRTVVVAHLKHNKDKMKLRGIEIFSSSKDAMNKFVWNNVLDAHLRMQNYEAVISLADEMRQRDIPWDSFACEKIILANTHAGSIEQATELLRANVDRMGFLGVVCYREIINYVTELGDLEEACKLYLELVQRSRHLSDWANALELAKQLPDDSMYWELREEMETQDPEYARKLPNSLLAKKDLV